MLLGVVVTSVEIGWHGGHSVARCFTLKLLEVCVEIDNLRPGGARESGGPSVGKGGECDVERWHLQGCSLRLCRLRTEGLVPVSKY
jgi:hypothetical protein